MNWICKRKDEKKDPTGELKKIYPINPDKRRQNHTDRAMLIEKFKKIDPIIPEKLRQSPTERANEIERALD